MQIIVTVAFATAALRGVPPGGRSPVPQPDGLREAVEGAAEQRLDVQMTSHRAGAGRRSARPDVDGAPAAAAAASAEPVVPGGARIRRIRRRGGDGDDPTAFLCGVQSGAEVLAGALQQRLAHLGGIEVRLLGRAEGGGGGGGPAPGQGGLVAEQALLLA